MPSLCFLCSKTSCVYLWQDQCVNGASDDKEKGRHVSGFDPTFTWGVLYILIFLSAQNLWTSFIKKRCLITLTMPKYPPANEVPWGIEHQIYQVFFLFFIFFTWSWCMNFVHLGKYLTAMPFRIPGLVTIYSQYV